MLTNTVQTYMYRYPFPMLNYCTRAWAWMGALIKWKRNGHNSSLFFYRKSWSGSISVFINFCNKYALSGVWDYSYTFGMLSFIYCMFLILHCKLIQTFDSCFFFVFFLSLFTPSNRNHHYHHLQDLLHHARHYYCPKCLWSVLNRSF